MIHVFDTSALIWIFDDLRSSSVWMHRIPHLDTICYHPVTLAEIAAQTHEAYNFRRRDPRRTAEQRRALLIALQNPAARPPHLRRKIEPFDTSRRATRSQRASVYDQLHFEKLQAEHLYEERDNVRVVASMVDHMILSVATFLHADSDTFGSFVTRDRQLYEAAQRVGVRAVYAAPYPPRPSDGRWL